jgi:Helicase conserved C-terminal domain
MKRFSSRRHGLDREFINQKLQRAVSYDRIAGYFPLIIGTDAASEGLNLQRLGTLISLDLPWSPIFNF